MPLKKRFAKKIEILAIFTGVLILTGLHAFGQTQPAGSTFDINVTTDFDDTQAIRVGEPFVWKILVRWYGTPDMLSPEIEAPPGLQGLKSISSSITLKNGSENNRLYSEKQFIYRFMPEREGEVSIGTASVRIKMSADSKPTVLRTAPLTLQAQSAPVSLSAFFYNLWMNLWIRVAFSILVMGGLIAVTIWFWMRSPNLDVQPDEQVVKNPVDEVFDVAQKHRIEGDYREYSHALERAVVMQWQEWYPEANGNRVADFDSKIADEHQIVYKRFLKECEEAKFAPVSLSPDALDRLWNDARRLVTPPLVSQS